MFVLSISEWPFYTGFTVKRSSCKHVGLYSQSVENSEDPHQMACQMLFAVNFFSLMPRFNQC